MKHFSPGYMLTAAIVGPGSITAASIAGSGFGFELVWVVVFAVFSTAVLQDMAARLGLISHQGLSESISNISSSPRVNNVTVLLVVITLAVGNSCLAASSITGMAISLQMLSNNHSIITLVFFSAAIAMIIPVIGVKQAVQPVLTGLIIMMVLSFLATMLIKPPSIDVLIKGLMPSIPDHSLFTIVAMLGSMATPYHLFLHSSTTAEKWSAQYPPDAILRCSRLDTLTSVAIAGVMMIAVMSTSATTYFSHGITIQNLEDIALQLEPSLGSMAQLLFGAGLFAASLTSAITCPMATAFAVCGVLKPGNNQIDSIEFKIIWLLVLMAGTVTVLLFSPHPINVVMLSQALNGAILPVLALLLLITVNKTRKVKDYINCKMANILSLLIVISTFALGIAHVMKIIEEN